MIAMLDEQTKVTKKGGTMRLGAQPCHWSWAPKRRGSTARSWSTNVTATATNSTTPIASGFRRRVLFQRAFPDGKLVEIIELAQHPFFIGSQFHPEFHSKPHQPHPLFKASSPRRSNGHAKKAHEGIYVMPETSIEKQRSAWWAEHYKPGMSVESLFRINEELIVLFPMTSEEREQRAEGLESVPEFVLWTVWHIGRSIASGSSSSA